MLYNTLPLLHLSQHRPRLYLILYIQGLNISVFVSEANNMETSERNGLHEAVTRYNPKNERRVNNLSAIQLLSTMRIYHYILAITILLLSFTCPGRSADMVHENIDFEHITVTDGLPNNGVACMIQDHEGYLWFGTKRGLCRYNGYDFKTYTSQLNDTTSLRYHQISALLEGSEGTIWIGTWAGGLHKYNRKKDNFIRINLNSQNDIDENISTLFEDSKGGVWIASQSKLFLLKKDQNESFEEIFHQDGINSISNVSSIYEDNFGTIFIASDNPITLEAYNPELNTTEAIHFTSSSGMMPDNINQIFPYDDKNLWLASDNGLFNYNKETKRINLVRQNNSPKMGIPLYFILKTKDDNLWMGGDKLYVYNKTAKQFKQFAHEAGNPKSISGNILTCGFQDNQKNIWIGSFSQGLNVIYHKTKHFNRNYKLAEKLENASKNITAIYKNKEGYLFLGTFDKKGLLIVNDKNEFVQSNGEFSGLNHLKEKVVRTINADKDGIIWIGSEDNLLTRFDFQNKQSKTYQIPGSVENIESQITGILTDTYSRIWVANPTGVFLFDPTAGTFSKLLSDSNTQNIEEDSRGNIWCANYNTNLCRINKDLSISYFKSNGKNTNLPNDKFVCVFKDSKDRMWVGTEFNGLFLYLPDSSNFQQFTVEDGLPSNDICSIEEDSKGRLWIGTNNGLSRFSYSLSDFSNYFRSDGMNADEFHYNSSYATKSGELYFGCTDGIVFFDPDDIRGDYLTFPIKIEGMKVNYGEVDKDLRGTPISEALRLSLPIKLKYDQNTISFDYSTINYSASKKSNFAYLLAGLNDDFNYVQNQRQVTYANLKPGKYIFKVIASNNDNIWDRKGVEIAFAIKNPPWLSWWAFLIYGLILILVFHGLRLQVRHEEKMKAAIRLERIEKNQQYELTQMKLRFFTNISHEFKTPLTLIIGPLEQIIADLHGNSGLKTKLTNISANSKRLLELINQLIDFRKIEQDVLPLKKTRNNLVETIQKVMAAFNPVAIKNEILFSLDTDFETLSFNYDQDKMEKILTNILSNAFKYTSRGGSISIRIWDSHESTVKITLMDTGSGIAPEKIKRIFEIFGSDNNNANSLEMQSSGIGLAYSKKLVELHGGSMEIESTPNKGTTLTIEIPYDRTLTKTTTDNNIIELNTKVKASADDPFETSLPDGENAVGLTSAPNILVVEDDEELRKYIVSTLMDRYQIDEAEDGEKGYELAQKNDYDLIVSDIMMPNMSGTQLCAKLKSSIKTSHIFVILLTAKSDISSKLQGYETGADSYITKPFLPQQLIQVIKNLLNTKQHIKSFYSSAEEKNQEPLGIHPRDKQFIADAIALIEKNMDEEKFGVESLGKELGLSRTHLFRKFKSLTGSAPNDFIRQIRLKKAARLIQESKHSISEIAYMVGFKTPANFSTSFKAFYGRSPKEYQRK